MTPRITFEHALEDLKNSLEEMGEHIEAVYDRLFLAVGAGDKNAIEGIMKEERIIRDMEKSIEARCLSLITRQQPVARDLRVISATLKIVTDLQRAGVHASDIGELAMRFEQTDIFAYSVHLAVMADAVKKQLCSAMECFLDRDMELAKKVIEGDDLVDELFNRIKEDVIRFLRNGEFPADECIDVMMIAKYLEKIGDHANNIAEWECFQETGDIQDVRLL